jgi:transglutaminase-like putative cysteine protease
MVLEISATPYIFTFKLWDWGRLGLDGKPRPINIEHGSRVIQWDRTTEWVHDNLVNQFETAEVNDAYEEEHTGLHELEFIETRRYTIHTEAEIKLHDAVSMCNLVDGESAEISSPDHTFEPFTVHYAESAELKMKVGVTYNNETVYYNYTPGSKAAYAFAEGDGFYTITLYRNVSGTSYAYVTSAMVTVELEDSFAPYLVSTTEITFSADDEVGKKATELCKESTDDAAKIVAIHNYIAKNFKYNYVFAAAVRRGSIKNYTPNTGKLLTERRGVCYDFSALFAAMCRSQGIPCAVAKGYKAGDYHAWNMVYLDGAWIAVDMTASISHRLIWADELADCTVSLDSYYGYTY